MRGIRKEKNQDENHQEYRTYLCLIWKKVQQAFEQITTVSRETVIYEIEDILPTPQYRRASHRRAGRLAPMFRAVYE